MSEEAMSAAAAADGNDVAVAPPQSVKMKAVAELEAIPGFTSLGTMVQSMRHLLRLFYHYPNDYPDGARLFLRVKTTCRSESSDPMKGYYGQYGCALPYDHRPSNHSNVPRYICEMNIWPYEDIEYIDDVDFLMEENPWGDHGDHNSGMNCRHNIFPIHCFRGPVHDTVEEEDEDSDDEWRDDDDGRDRVLDDTTEIIAYLVVSLDGMIDYLQQQNIAAPGTLQLTIGSPPRSDGRPCEARIPNNIVSRLVKAVSKSMNVSTFRFLEMDMDNQLWSDLSDLLLTKVGADHPLKSLDLFHTINKCDDVSFLKRLEGRLTTKSSHSQTILGQIEKLGLHCVDKSLYPILFGMFAGHPGLQKFQVDCANSHDDETLESISRILATFPKLSAFGLIGNDGNSRFGMKFLIPGLKKAGSLVQLSFSATLFEHDEAKEFCQYLSSPPGSNVKKLKLLDVLGPEYWSAARIVMNELRHNSSIKELVIAETCRDGRFAEYGFANETMALLQENTTLVKLELGGGVFWRPLDPRVRGEVHSGSNNDGLASIKNKSLRTLEVSAVSHDTALKLVKWVGSRKCKIEEFVLQLEYDSREKFKSAIEKLIRNGSDRSPPDETDRYHGFLKRLHIESGMTNKYLDDVEQRIQRHIHGLEGAFQYNPFGLEEVFIGAKDRKYITFDFDRQLEFWNDCQSSESSKELLASLAMAPHIFASMSKNPSIMFESMRCQGSVVLPAVLVRGAKNLALDVKRDSAPAASKKPRKRCKRSET